MNMLAFIIVVVAISIGIGIGIMGAGFASVVNAQTEILEGFEADPGQPIPPCPKGSITTELGCALPDAV